MYTDWHCLYDKVYREGHYFCTCTGLKTAAMSPTTQTETDTTSTDHMLQSMIDASGNSIAYCEAVWEHDQLIDFTFRLANQAFCQSVGKPAGQVLGASMTQLFPSVKDLGAFDRYVEVATTGEAQEFELAYQADGRTTWYTIIARPLSKGFVLSYTNITARKLDELQRQKQTEQLQFVTDNALTAISLYSIVRDSATGEVIDLRYELLNQMAEQMTGRKAEDLVGRTMLEVFPGIVTSGVWARYRELAQTGIPLRYQNHYTHDGYNLWYQVQGIRRNDQIVLSFLDITELKQSQEEKQRQADEFRQILDNALTAISHFTAVRDDDGQVIDFVYRSFNQTSEDITGLKADQVIGQRMLELFPGVRTSGVFDHWVRLMESGNQERFQDKYSFDGFDFWYDTQATKYGDGFIQSYIDITPIKQAELDRQRQADFLTLILQTSPGGIIAYEAIREPADSGNNRETSGAIQDFRPIFFNTAYEQISGDTAETIWQRTFRQRFRDDDQLFKFYVELTETGQPVRRERYYPHLSKWLDVAGAKLQDGFLVVVNDITIRKEAEQQRQVQAEALEEANRQLARSNGNLQQFAYVASHDLQEPLRKIQSFGSILQERYAPFLDEQANDMLNRMRSASTRMSILIKDLLDYSRLTTQPPTFQPQHLGRIVEGVLTMLDIVIQEKRAVIDVGDLDTVPGDETQLTQLFQNLLTNALKFTKSDESGLAPSTYVRIYSQTISQADLPLAYQAMSNHATYCVVRVSDNGIGFDALQADYIFGAFQRLHTRKHYPGTGIGLAIAKKVVENHHGFIAAESQLGQGATFIIYLPKDDLQAND